MTVDLPIAILDDDRESLRTIASWFEGRAFSVFETPAQMYASIRYHGFGSFVIGDNGGYDVESIIKKLRLQDRVCAPVIVLSHNNDPSAIARTLRLGGDDWIIRPVVPSVLLARLDACVRRSEWSWNYEHGCVSVGNVTLDLGRKKAWVNREPLLLTDVEFRLLAVYLRHVGVLLDRNTLLRTVWGSYPEKTRKVDTHTSRLRSKLEALDPAWTIDPVSGCGYRMRLLR